MRPGPLWLIVLAACNAPDDGPRWRAAGATAPHRGGTLRFSSEGQISTLDPSVAYDESLNALHFLFDTLIDYEPAGTRIVPRLAERWEISDDGKTYHFWLRPNLKYADGRPIVAADFKFSLERALTLPESPFGPMLVEVVGATALQQGKATECAGVTVQGDRELTIQLQQRSVAFLHILTMKFTTPQRADHVTAAGDQIRRRPLATGPYALDEWLEGERFVVNRNPYYFDDHRGYLDAIVMFENIPRDVQLLMFDRGELDTAERLSPPDALWLANQEAWKPYVHVRSLMNAYGARMNVRAKPFDDVRVRRALNYALDKSSTVKILTGSSTPSHGLLAPGVFGRDDTIEPYPYDPARAKALLAEAGYRDGLDLEYVTIKNHDNDNLAVVMQADFAKVGVRVRITSLGIPSYIALTNRLDGPPFSIGSWIGDYPDPTTFFDVMFHSRMIGTNNASQYANPELDALLDAARAEPDVDKRAAMYRRAERILYDDAPWVWNYHWRMTEVTQPYVRDYEPHPVWLRDYTTTWLDLGPDGAPVAR
ncbi:MAG: ABC transporter substrate-binding protein [Kofleriaceae bacterium]